MEENGTVRRVIEHARDITDQRKACEALRQSKESLEEEVRQRTEELIRSERLSAVGTLASGVAHEFNNINVTVLGFAELGTELPNLPADARDFFERIQSAGRRAKRITQNMLSFTRHASPVPQAADLRQTIRGALDLMRHEFATTGVEVVERLDPTPSSMMEPDLIAQVALNLLINAQHAMHGADRRVLTVRCGKEGDRLCFSVEDTGCGMNEETRRQIFSPFFTTKGEKAPDGSPMGSLRGTGLGLSVCHTIVRNHDGEIRCDSAPGRGTTFTVALPFHPPSTPDDTSAQASASAAPAPKGRVLALDDEPEVCELVSMALGGGDLQIECFQDPETALDYCCAQAVDVLLLDLQMPRMNGWEVARRLRATGGSHQPRILILTGRTAAVAEEDLIRCGIDGVVTKPFEVRELRDRIDACLQRR
jgi:signal transduction histidine kinase/CheY-like chemotaxis protein